MNHYSFIAAAKMDLMSLNDVKHRENIAESIQLNALDELSLLVSNLDSGLTIPPPLNIEDVKEIWTITGPLCHFSHTEFDTFYRHWLTESTRPDSPEEREQLERLNAFIPALNNADICLIVLMPGQLNS